MTTLIERPETSACTQADFAICCRGGVAYQLPNTAAAKSNVAIFQLTATLPFSMEVVFLGGQSDVQKTIRGPVNMCVGCTPEKSPKPEIQSERLAALSGKPGSAQNNEREDVSTCHVMVASMAISVVIQQRPDLADHATLQRSCIMNAGLCSL